MEYQHKSVLLTECIDGLAIKPNGIYVDCTLGGGGHSLEICKKLSDKGILVGVDQDVNAMDKASTVLKNYQERTILVKGNFFNIKNILESLDIKAVDGIIVDLGVSSFQLDEPTRGFSYMNDAILDMRMDISATKTAKEVINYYSEKELCRIITEYGEERWAKRIAEFIIEERKKYAIETTFQLVSVIKKAIPKNAREDGPHPAKRTFQAIRIEVNQELVHLENAIEEMVEKLNSEGRICIISFHSLEDRIVKSVFRRLEASCVCPPEFPQCICQKKSTLKAVNRKPIEACEVELEQNPRARSAKLRVGKKL